MIYGGLDDGANLPIPNRERNNGGSLIVWSGHPQRAVLPPWKKPASEADVDLIRKLESSQLSQTSHGYGPPSPPPPPHALLPPSTPSESESGERRGSRSRLPIIILSAVLFLIIAALIVVSSILGTKIAKLENTISPLAVAVAESAANGTTTNNNNNNNNPYTTTSTTANNLNPSQTTTTTSSTAPPPAPLPPTIQVAGWTYLGCFYDSEVRVLPEAFLSATDMTNAGCADYCSEGGKTPRHFGTQVAVQCYCGTATQAVLASRRAPDWMCMHQCAGRWGVSENCGGNWVLSLWERDED
ncbi:hypothetical protein F5144DRAFT_608467 [Chaetomium tenue]|uniref:Uncharacterized protein n=1 Tax=Chaetomium tenue TaxID=1854479 RepID=A0ACB7PSH0_9PEZI|nr:hypothetical protein F5144DRAFT_608467 [Chaetomium globosum]